jgi:hypothetical protein
VPLSQQLENCGKATELADIRSSIQWRALQGGHTTSKGESLQRSDDEVGVTGDKGCKSSSKVPRGGVAFRRVG